MCCGNKIVGRQHNAKILYFTANCGQRGNNRNLKRSHTGRKQNVLGSSFYHSGVLDVSNENINSQLNGTPDPLRVYIGSKRQHNLCTAMVLHFNKIHRFCSHHCHSLFLHRHLLSLSIVDIVVFSHDVDHPHHQHNHDCRCSGCNL